MPTGHLGTWTFASISTGLNVIDITPPEEAVSDIALPHLGLAKGSYVPYEAGELIEGGEYELTLADDNDTQLVDSAYGTSGGTIKKLVRLSQTMTWTKPPAGANTNGATRAFTGYVKSVQEQPQVTGTRSTIKVKIKVAGNVTKGAGS